MSPGYLTDPVSKDKPTKSFSEFSEESSTFCSLVRQERRPLPGLHPTFHPKAPVVPRVELVPE